MTAHFVYRCYDADDRLLYVGRTYDVNKRLRAHRYRHAPWLAECVRVESDEYPNFAVAKAAERVAIVCERPRANKTHLFWSPVQVRKDFLVALTAAKRAGARA